MAFSYEIDLKTGPKGRREPETERREDEADLILQCAGCIAQEYSVAVFPGHFRVGLRGWGGVDFAGADGTKKFVLVVLGLLFPIYGPCSTSS
jgi:hypothetical protein